MKRFLLTAALLTASALPPACAQQGRLGPTTPDPPEQPSAADVTPRGATPGATAPAAAAAAAADLSLEQVRRLQQRLGELGFDPGPVDGIWGERTRAALRAFQEARDLEPTGDPTEPTLAALGVEGGAGQEAAAAATTGSGTEVTGLVTAVDEQAHEIVIDGQTYVMPEQSGTAMLPAEGDRVTLFYREEGGRRVITRIGQPRQR